MTPDNRDGAPAEPAPPGWIALDPGERAYWRGSPRIQSAIPWMGVAVGGALFVPAAFVVEALPPFVALLAVVVSVAIGLWGTLSIVRTEYLVTNRRLAAKRGVVGRVVAEMDMDRVQNTSASQHALGAAIGYGTVTADSAGGGDEDLSFRNVDDPQRVRRLVDEAGRDGSEVPGSVEQWEAILTEVRTWRRAVTEDAD